MEVKNIREGEKGKFYIEENGKELAQMTYVYAGESKLIIDHTEVYPENEGRGLGKILVNAVADFARKNNIKILPLCPYAKAVMTKNREQFADVLV